MGLEAGLSWDAPPPTEHGRQSIEIALDHPVNPWEHEGAGTINRSARLDRLAPLGEEAVRIIKSAWAQRLEDPHEKTKREEGESEPVDRQPTTSMSIHPGWATRVESNQYWIHMTLYQPINERWVEETQETEEHYWSRGELVNDGIVQRSVTVEATTRLGRQALRIVEALHSAHPCDEQERGTWYEL